MESDRLAHQSPQQLAFGLASIRASFYLEGLLSERASI